MRNLVIKFLLQSVTIRAKDEDKLDRIKVAALPDICYKLATQLHFRSGLTSHVKDRCPHAHDQQQESSIQSDGEEDQHESQSHFIRLTQRAKSVLEKFNVGQLHSFR